MIWGLKSREDALVRGRKSWRLRLARRSRLRPRLGAVISVVVGALAGFLINLATAGGYGWLIPVLAVVAVGLWAAIEFMRNADPDGVALAMWLQELIGRYNSAGWTDHPIDLLALGQGGREIPAKSAVENWVDEKAGRVLVLTGTFGSGKTWTLRWLAQRLAARWIGGDPSVPVPVLVSLTQLSDSDVMTREQLRQLAWPAPISEQILSSGNSHVLLLLDGLDELLSLDGSDLRAKKVLTFIAAAEPPSTRFLISCRADVLASEPALRELAQMLAKPDTADQTAWAVMTAVEPERTHLDCVHILDVPEDRADSYLLASTAGDYWRTVRNQAAYWHLARSPFTIFLLQEALPRLSVSRAGATLPLLYLKAVESWLLRAGRSPEVVEDSLTRLETIATAFLFDHVEDFDDESDSYLLRAGILTRQPDGSCGFRHYSLAEYFLCRAVFRQMADYSSSLLSRLDLVNTDSLNRFLVPMLRAELEQERPVADKVAPACRTVTFEDFRRFTSLTGWRNEGYGTWRTLGSADGPVPWQGLDIGRNASISDFFTQEDKADARAPVTGISWYDAFEYCRWAGGRLPAATELSTTQLQSSNCRRLWCSSWKEESSGLLAVIRTDHSNSQETGLPKVRTKLEGLNPDLRLNDLGFMIIGQESPPSQRQIVETSPVEMRRIDQLSELARHRLELELGSCRVRWREPGENH